MNKKNHVVAVLGASNKPVRYSNKAVRLLKEKGYVVIPVHPTLQEIEELPVKHSLDEIEEEVNTLTIYLSPERSQEILYGIIDLKPKRVILNPGTESVDLEKALERECIPYHKACTLVLLNTGRF